MNEYRNNMTLLPNLKHNKVMLALCEAQVFWIRFELGFCFVKSSGRFW